MRSQNEEMRPDEGDEILIYDTVHEETTIQLPTKSIPKRN